MTALADRMVAEIPSLRAFARKIIRNNQFNVDDLVQDTLVRAIAKQDTFQEGTNLRAWLMTILRHQYVNDVRANVKRPQGAEDNISLDVTPDNYLEPYPALKRTAEQNRSGLIVRDLKRCLAKLPKEQREAVLMVGNGLKYEQIAEIVDVPVGTVRSRLSRGRSALRELMDGGLKRPRMVWDAAGR